MERLDTYIVPFERTPSWVSRTGQYGRRWKGVRCQGHIHLQRVSICAETKLTTSGDSQRIAGVLLDAENGELDGDVEGWVGDIGLLVTETHGADEAYSSSDLAPTRLTSGGNLRSYFTGRLVKSGPTNVG